MRCRLGIALRIILKLGSRDVRSVVLLLSLLAASLSGCGGDDAGTGHPRSLTIVTSFYPLKYAVERVVGEHVDLRNLTPAGVEPHDLELTTDDVDLILDADLVFYVGSDFQPAVSAAVRRRDGVSVDVGRGLIEGNDPHFWLDPMLMAKAVDKITTAMDAAARDGASNRAGAGLKQDLVDIDREFATTLSQCKRKQIVTAHASFSYLANRYGLTQLSISGVTPESEPDPRHLAALVDLVRREGITTVFYEALVPRGFAETLAREAGVKTAVLNPLEGLSTDQVDAAADYLSVMRDNLAALATALDCTPAV